jgi:AraC-like DNA-binding protein
MNIEHLLLIILSGLGVFHGVFIAIILWNNKTGLYNTNRILAILMLIFSIRIAKSVVLEFSPNLNMVYVYGGLTLLMFLGPLFFLYSKLLFRRENIISRSDIFHFIPGVVFLSATLPFNIIGFRNLPQWFGVLLFLVFYSHFLFYLLYTKIKFLKADTSSGVSSLGVQWLNILFYGLLVIWLVYVLNLFEEDIPYIIGPIMYSISVYVITYVAVTRKYIQQISAIKYQTMGLPDEDINSLFSSIENMMQHEKLYLNPDITLAVLSKHLMVSPQKISLAVNSRSANNFNEYINKFRVNHAIEILKNPQSHEMTIASIAFDSGFNSISSFNTVFKKVAGKTPSAYREIQP